MILKQPPREWIGTFRFVILRLAFRDSLVGLAGRGNKYHYICFSLNATSLIYRHFRQLGLVASDTGSLLKVGLGIAIAALGGIFLIRFVRSSQS